ncbi:zinc-dependent alcohol dehydrogenase family protein [Paucibacter sediminis]|uniref:Zinc-dependent alcohol dehydrogenase family protein n=1 Tax=Paucibacter sediminis TaxID=3019553 RepID=A0AA95NHA0_9BURK|nr:zinc-dependent alcohol dehydrogenase family protein [Paucibacter sp. S2-9]WIT12318.1 zinc-dependent alcohol dehydrogenase family protein [Paucibacter sp. S2-9]
MTTTSMRALVLEATDGPFLSRTLPVPVPGPGQVLLEIAASGVNPLDGKIRAGKAAHARHALPAVLGMDVAGVVRAVGPGVARLRVGDQVYGLTGGVGGLQGSLAEFAAVDADLLARKPANLSMREAAALPLITITAWEGLVDRARTRAGQKVLVHGGAGGVGHVAVQLAKALGAEVYATVSPEQAETVRRFGATPIDYRTTAVEAYVAEHTGGLGFDVIYDTVGGAVLDAAFQAVRPHVGHVLSCLGWGTHALAPLSFRAASYSGVFTLLPLLTGEGRAHHGHILEEAAKLAERGQLVPLMDARRYTLDSALAAHEEVAAGRARGRLVVEVRA